MQGGGGIPQPGQAGLWDNGGDECGEDESGGAPHQRPREAGARGGETSSTSTPGLDQECDQQMGQRMRLGQARVLPGRFLQPHQALQALEGKFHPPPQAIQSAYVLAGKQSADNR